MHTKHPLPILIGILALAVLAFLIFWGWVGPFFQLGVSPSQKAIEAKHRKEKEYLEHLNFNLVDPNQAPASIRDLVKFGYQIMLDTPKNASKYAGDRLSCTNCHFAGGDTTGGKNGGISLAGSAAMYPRFDKRIGEVIDLPKRINLCFERSMNGKALPLDSKEMLALVAYLQWISKGIPIYQNVPWLGLPHLEKKHNPDPEQGKKIYDVQCALCHGKEGQGEVQNEIPPLWGPHSFNDKAGMNSEDTLASFNFYNMPYTEATLTEEQAWDVAAFIVRQPRPHND